MGVIFSINGGVFNAKKIAYWIFWLFFARWPETLKKSIFFRDIIMKILIR